MIENRPYGETETREMIRIAQQQTFAGNIDKAAEDLQHLLHLLDGSAAHLSPTICNALGNIFIILGNYSLALDFFQEGLKYADRYGDMLSSGKIFCNIGSMFVTVHDYTPAVDYLKRSLSIFSDINDPEIQNLVYINKATLGICLVKTGHAEKAADLVTELEALGTIDEFSYSSRFLFLAMYYNKVGNNNEAENYIKLESEHMSNCPDLMYAIDDFTSFLEFLLDNKYYEEFVKAHSVYKKVSSPLKVQQLNRKSEEIYCRYCIETGNTTELNSVLKNVYEYDQLLFNTEQKTTLNNIRLRLSFEKMKQKQEKLVRENERLRIKASTDELTGIANRFGFNNEFDLKFEKAYKAKTLIGVDFFDIDNFKGYNDTYSHLAGNECLKKLAGLLKSLRSKNVYPARYGGDEFIILLSDMTAKEMENFAMKLKEGLYKLHIEHIGSPDGKYVTISQGISYVVPKMKLHSWDLLRNADLQLYRTKRKSKNGYSIDEYKPDELQHGE